MKDYAYEERQRFIASVPAETREDKVARAKETLGTRYVCHKVNHVKRNPQKAPEALRVDVRRTFRRYRERNRAVELV